MNFRCVRSRADPYQLPKFQIDHSGIPAPPGKVVRSILNNRSRLNYTACYALLRDVNDII
jgi:hypothetical protein